MQSLLRPLLLAGCLTACGSSGSNDSPEPPPLGSATPLEVLELPAVAAPDDPGARVRFSDGRGYDVEVVPLTLDPLRVATPIYLDPESLAISSGTVRLDLVTAAGSVPIEDELEIEMLAPAASPGAVTRALAFDAEAFLDHAMEKLDEMGADVPVDPLTVADSIAPVRAGIHAVYALLGDSAIELGTIMPQGQLLTLSTDGSTRALADRVLARWWNKPSTAIPLPGAPAKAGLSTELAMIAFATQSFASDPLGMGLVERVESLPAVYEGLLEWMAALPFEASLTPEQQDRMATWVASWTLIEPLWSAAATGSDLLSVVHDYAQPRTSHGVLEDRDRLNATLDRTRQLHAELAQHLDTLLMEQDAELAVADALAAVQELAETGIELIEQLRDERRGPEPSPPVDFRVERVDGEIRFSFFEPGINTSGVTVERRELPDGEWTSTHGTNQEGEYHYVDYLSVVPGRSYAYRVWTWNACCMSLGSLAPGQPRISEHEALLEIPLDPSGGGGSGGDPGTGADGFDGLSFKRISTSGNSALSFCGDRVKMCDWFNAPGTYYGDFDEDSLTMVFDELPDFTYEILGSPEGFTLFVLGEGVGTYAPMDWEIATSGAPFDCGPPLCEEASEPQAGPEFAWITGPLHAIIDQPGECTSDKFTAFILSNTPGDLIVETSWGEYIEVPLEPAGPQFSKEVTFKTPEYCWPQKCFPGLIRLYRDYELLKTFHNSCP